MPPLTEMHNTLPNEFPVAQAYAVHQEESNTGTKMTERQTQENNKWRQPWRPHQRSNSFGGPKEGGSATARTVHVSRYRRDSYRSRHCVSMTPRWAFQKSTSAMPAQLCTDSVPQPHLISRSTTTVTH